MTTQQTAPTNDSPPSNEQSVVKVSIDIPMSKDEAGKFVHDAVAMGGQQQHKPAVDFSKFASVDNVELVGVHSQIPALQEKLQEATAPLVGKQIDAPDMESFAKNIVNLIEQAHQQIVAGKQVLRTMSDQAFEKRLAADSLPQLNASEPQVSSPSEVAQKDLKLEVQPASWAEKLASLSVPRKPSEGFTLGA